MHRLFAFIYRFRAFLVFVILEIASVYLIIRNNTYQNAAFFNTANFYVGQVLDFKSEVTDYFRLFSINTTLVQENARLREQLLKQEKFIASDTLGLAIDSVFIDGDTARPEPYRLRPARVIKNSVRFTNNFITLDVGRADGVKPGMGVMAPDGVVGRVKNVSEHYATATSVLHSQMLLSAKIRKNNTFGTVKWNNSETSFTHASLNFIPLHVKPVIGDTVVTSGYNSVFPEGIMIGTISKFNKEPDKSFYNIEIKLTVDFSQLSFVYVLENLTKPEQDSLELKTGIREDE